MPKLEMLPGERCGTPHHPVVLKEISTAYRLDVVDLRRRPALIDPASPGRTAERQNADNESFNGKHHDECLGVEWFARKPK